jgi:hypothetical protein
MEVGVHSLWCVMYTNNILILQYIYFTSLLEKMLYTNIILIYCVCIAFLGWASSVRMFRCNRDKKKVVFVNCCFYLRTTSINGIVYYAYLSEAPLCTIVVCNARNTFSTTTYLTYAEQIYMLVLKTILNVGETGAFLARGNFSQLTFELVNLTLKK